MLRLSSVRPPSKTVVKPGSHGPGVRPGAPRQTWTIREVIRVRSHIPGNATDQTRPNLGQKLITSLRRLTEVSRQRPGVTR